MSLLQLSCLAALLFVAYKILPVLLHPFLTSLRCVPGPPTTSWFWGNFKDQTNGNAGEKILEWGTQYGHVFKYKTLLSLDRLAVTDTKAINHIMTHSDEYRKPEVTRIIVTRVFGEGILFVEGEAHRKQRRLMNPAFGYAQIRDLTSLFLEKSTQLRDIWANSVQEKGDDWTRIDVLPDISRMTLDVIGLAGFGYEFNALNPSGEVNPLSQALNEILGSAGGTSIVGAMAGLVPGFQYLPTKAAREINAARKKMMQIGSELVAERKAYILATAGEKNVKVSDSGFEGRDLLTLLMKANMASDIPESQRLRDEDVVAQIPTFFVAGHETTSSAVTWCLYALSSNTRVQQKLREELMTMPNDMPSMDELMTLPYLDLVLRETLRLFPPVTATIRQATKEDFIPLNKPFTDKYGEVHDTIKVGAGDQIVIPIVALHRMKEIWGEDADEFKPERWECIPEAVSSIPGVWGNIFSFIGGARGCIGYRFSLIEFKALLFTLLRALEFNLAVPADDIARRTAVLMRPVVKSEAEKGNQMPLLIRPVRC